MTSTCTLCWFANGDGVSAHCGKCTCCYCDVCYSRVELCDGCTEDEDDEE